MMKKNRLKVLAAGLIFNSALLLGTNVQAQVPTAVDYSGKISDSSGAIDGTGFFKFAFVDAEGNVLWSNSEADSGVPTTAMEVSVDDGVYSVTLGTDDSPISSDVFATDGVKFQAWFSTASDGTFELVADSVVNAVPTAIKASNAATATSATTAGTATSAQSIALVDSEGNPVVDDDGNPITFSGQDIQNAVSFRTNSMPTYAGESEYTMIKGDAVSWTLPFKPSINSVEFSDDSAIPGVTLGSGSSANVAGTPSTTGSYTVNVAGVNAAGTSVEAAITFKVGTFTISKANKLQAYNSSDKVIDNSNVKLYAGQDFDLKFTPTTDVPITSYKWDYIFSSGASGSIVTTDSALPVSAIDNDAKLSAASYTVGYTVSPVYGLGDKVYTVSGSYDTTTVTVNTGYAISYSNSGLGFTGGKTAGGSDSATVSIDLKDTSVSRNFSYQWEYLKKDGSTYAEIDGATTQQLTLGTLYDRSVYWDLSKADPATSTPAVEFQAGAETSYRCVVDDGFYKLQGSAISFSLADNIQITSTPVDINVKATEKGTFYVTAINSNSKGTLSYQWQAYNSSDSKWENISGATNRIYTTDTVVVGGTYNYRAVVSTGYSQEVSHTDTTGAKITVVNDWAHLWESTDTPIADIDNTITTAIGANTWYTSDGVIAVYVDDASDANDGFVAASNTTASNSVDANWVGTLAADDIVYVAYTTYLDVTDGIVTVDSNRMVTMPSRTPTVEVWAEKTGTTAGLVTTDGDANQDIKLGTVSDMTSLNTAKTAAMIVTPDLTSNANQFVDVNGTKFATVTTYIKMTCAAAESLTGSATTDTVSAGTTKLYLKIYTPGIYQKDAEYVTINL